MSFSLGHPKEQEPQIHRKAYFPRSTGLPVLGRAHHEHHVPIRTFQNEGWCPWDTKCRTVSKQKFVEPKVLEITWQKIFPSEMFPWRWSQQGLRRDSQLWWVRVSVGREGTAHCHAVPSTDTSWLPPSHVQANSLVLSTTAALLPPHPSLPVQLPPRSSSVHLYSLLLSNRTFCTD